MAKRHQIATNMSPATEEPLTPPTRTTCRSANFASIYVNDIQIMTSAWDVRLILGELGDGDLTSVNITQLGEVRLSPQLAKRVTMLLAEQLRKYEAAFGEIPLPKE